MLASLPLVIVYTLMKFFLLSLYFHPLYFSLPLYSHPLFFLPIYSCLVSHTSVLCPQEIFACSGTCLANVSFFWYELLVLTCGLYLLLLVLLWISRVGMHRVLLGYPNFIRHKVNSTTSFHWHEDIG